MRRAVCAPLIGAVLMLSCLPGALRPHYLLEGERMREVTEASRLYADSMRWGEFETAAALVHPELRREFIALFTDRSEPFRFTNVEVKAVELGGERGEAQALVQVSLYRLPSMEQVELTDAQDWRYASETGRWYVWPDLELYAGTSPTPRARFRGSR